MATIKRLTAAARIRAKRKKEPVTTKVNIQALINKKASEIREDGETWKDARARAKKLLSTI